MAPNDILNSLFKPYFVDVKFLMYSCNKITTTWIQISRQLNGFLSSWSNELQ